MAVGHSISLPQGMLFGGMLFGGTLFGNILFVGVTRGGAAGAASDTGIPEVAMQRRLAESPIDRSHLSLTLVLVASDRETHTGSPPYNPPLSGTVRP
jgi:hypothetical protein